MKDGIKKGMLLVVIMMWATLCSAEDIIKITLSKKELTWNVWQAIYNDHYDSIKNGRESMIIEVGDVSNGCSNGFDHRWWKHITRHITWSNGYQVIKTVAGVTFVTFFAIAVVIQKAYASIAKIITLCSFRSLDTQSEDVYRTFKKYELLFISYKKLDKLLQAQGIRSYFICHPESDEAIDDALAYITMYEKKQFEISLEND
jgi:hypothetical protein